MMSVSFRDDAVMWVHPDRTYGGDHDRLAVLYRQAMELELRFFDAADRCGRP